MIAKKPYLCRPMRISSFFTVIVCCSLGLFFSSCRSEFEKVRTSNDAKLIYEKATAYFEEEEYQKAQSLYELAISGYRGQKEAEDISFKYAYTFFHTGRYILSAYHFKNFSQTFSTSPKRQESDFMVAYSNYQLSPSFRLDQSYTKEAIDAFQLFINTYPESDRVEQANRLIDEMRLKQELKSFDTAKLYYDIRRYQAAVHSFENLLKDFPDTKSAERVRYLIIDAAYLLAINSFIEKKGERLEDVIDRADDFLKKYPESQYVNQVQTISSNSTKNLNQLANVGY